LECRARERYGALDRLDAKLSWYRGQYDVLDALVEALRTIDGWVVYRAEVLRDQLPELDAGSAEDVSTVERVKTALVDREEALQKAREDLAGARTLRRSGRPRWPQFGPSSNKTTRPSREHVHGRARPKRRPRRQRS
jgi:hypothetical protein